MAIQLPALSVHDSLAFNEVEFAGFLKSSLGGPTQRMVRPGTRLQVKVDLRPMKGACARTWLAAVMRSKAEGQTLRLSLPQLGNPGASGVTGSGLAGASTIGATATVGGILVGQWFSFITAGHSYMHMVTVAGATLGISPALRTICANGTTLDFATPTIEGFIEQPVAWTLERLMYYGQSFILTEDR